MDSKPTRSEQVEALLQQYGGFDKAKQAILAKPENQRTSIEQWWINDITDPSDSELIERAGGWDGLLEKLAFEGSEATDEEE